METKRKTAIITAIIMCVLLFLLPDVISFISMLGSQTASGNEIIGALTFLPLQLLLPCVLISLVYVRKTKTSLGDFFRLNPITGKELLLLTVVALALPFFINTVIHYSSKVFGAPEIISQVQADGNASFLKQAGTFLFILFSMFIIPGLCEEAFFRGALFSLLKDSKAKTAVMVLISALVFAIFHKNPAQLVYTFLIGIVFGLCVYITNSLWAGAFVHALYNFSYALRYAVDVEKYTFIGKVTGIIANTNHILISLTAAALIAAVLSYMYQQRKKAGSLGRPCPIVPISLFYPHGLAGGFEGLFVQLSIL